MLKCNCDTVYSILVAVLSKVAPQKLIGNLSTDDGDAREDLNYIN